MIRLRSTKLLSGVSAIAVLTMLGVAPAHAALTFSGVNLYPPIVNTAESDTITVDTLALINSDDQTGSPDQGNSITNEIDMSGAGDKITIDDATLAGGILNRTGVTITSTDAAAVLLTNTAVMGGALINQGNLAGGTNGFEVNNSHVIRGMFNDVGATITGATNGVAIVNDSSWLGGISNEGSISGVGGDGVRMAGTLTDFAGGITNFEGGVFSGKGATAAGIDIGFGGAISSFTDDIDNAGVIQGLNGGRGIYVNATTFDGNISNREGGIIQGTGANAYGIYLFGGAFNGSIDNSGSILALGAGGRGVVVGGTTAFTGDVINNDVGIIRAAGAAVMASGTSFLGSIKNYGFIQSTGGNAIDVTTNSFTGDVYQQFGGTILAAATGIHITSTNFTGNVENHGSIQGAEGLRLDTGAVLTGNIIQSGTVVGTTGDGIRIRGTVSGSVTNLEMLQGAVAGLANESTIAGGITNSGTIVGTQQSIDLQLETGATTITQTAGLLQGTLRLDQSVTEYDDTVNFNGGQLRGNIDGGGGDDINVAGNFAYVNGTADELDQVTVNSGTAVFGSTAVGVDGVGVTFTNTNALTVNGGTAYLDDNTTIGLNNDLTVNANGTLAYYLTSNTATHGQVNAGANANLDGTLRAVTDGTSFASIGGDTFTYTNIITGAVNGTFADVTTNSLFFDAQAIYHANAVDLELDRLSFNDVLTLGTLTHNQAQVGGALETIYTGGTFGTDFEDLFNYLMSLPSGSQSQVAAIYDELGGAEHAQVQQATLRATEPFDTAIGDRLDEGKLGLRGTGWAQNGETRYADAAQQQRMMSDAAPAQRSDSQGLLRGSTGVSIWGRGYGDWTDVDGDLEAPGYKQDAAGAVAGLDFLVGDNAIVGGAFGWSTNSLDFDTPRDHADIDSFEFGGYGSVGFGRFYADGQLSFAFHDVNTTRELDLGYDTFIAGANYNARTWTLAGEVGTVFRLGKLNMQPMVGVNYTGASTDGFIENGAGDLSLIVADADTNSFTSTVGMRFSGLWTVGGTRLVPDASIAWRHEFADTTQSFTAAFLEDPSTSIDIISSKVSPDSAIVNAGLTAGVTQGLELFVDYNGIINSDATSHNGSAGFRATW
jgi:fibronectin-binding autotransporter adhesin